MQIYVNWDNIPEQYQYVARDEDDQYYAYTTPPHCGRIVWQETDRYCESIVLDIKDILDDTVTHWQDSLIKRPEIENMKKISVDWDKIPNKYIWVARDDDGNYNAFAERPEMDGFEWDDKSGETIHIPYIPYILEDSAGHWSTAIIQRPLKNHLKNMFDGLEEEYKWIAMDRDGRVYAYKSLPVMDDFNGIWMVSDNTAAKLVASLSGRYDDIETLWMDTLVFTVKGEWIEDTSLVEDTSWIEVDWKRIPPNFQYVARDSDNIYFAYQKKPYIKNGEWTSNFELTVVDQELITHDNTEWKNSLVERNTEIRVNWDNIPEQYQYVARDACGVYYAYPSAPKMDIHEGHWMNDEGLNFYCVPEMIEYDDTHWQQSLVKRPVSDSNESSMGSVRVNWEKGWSSVESRDGVLYVDGMKVGTPSPFYDFKIKNPLLDRDIIATVDLLDTNALLTLAAYINEKLEEF